MFQMLVLKDFSWTFMDEADQYRRRPFPLNFLQYECSNYPIYAFTSELSKAFNHVGEIETEVDLSEHDLIKFKMKDSNETLIYRNFESLVTSTKEFINHILRWVYEEKRIHIQPQSGNELTLKVNGYREYLMGNYQLLQYERVRFCLRKKLKLQLILTEINTNHRDVFFPPIFKIDKSIHYPIKHIKAY